MLTPVISIAVSGDLPGLLRHRGLVPIDLLAIIWQPAEARAAPAGVFVKWTLPSHRQSFSVSILCRKVMTCSTFGLRTGSVRS